MKIRMCTRAIVPFFAALLLGCSRGGPPPDEAKQRGLTAGNFAPAEYDHFAGMDVVAGMEPGKVKVPTLTPEEIKGRNAWMMWTGGNEAFWDWLARHGYGTMDLLQVLDSSERDTRFERAGLVTEPGTRPPTAEETKAAYGIRYDRLIDPKSKYQLPNPDVYGYSTGIVGLRLFRNPEFTRAAEARWDAVRYYKDPTYSTRPDTIRPYRVGMSCGFCHAAPHPLNPPSDPKSPNWENLSGNIGNQYLRIRAVFGNMLKKDNYLYHVLDAQLPGTIDTSMVASDNINNANSMNAVFGLEWRIQRALKNPPETLSPESAVYPGLWQDRTDYMGGNPRYLPRVLVDGSDSVGAWIAMARVYLNIGSYHEQWIRLHNPFLGFRKQEPFKLADCEENSVYWHATKARVDPMLAFFIKSTDPMRLKDAPDGKKAGGLLGEGVPWDDAYEKGRKVFASSCIACHSSIQPGDVPELEEKVTVPGFGSDHASLRLRTDDLARLTRGDGKLPPAYAAWAEAAVEQRELFWKQNYLSTDMRIPVAWTRTNSARAMATNSVHGNIWEDFASLTYKELDSVGRISYRDPFSGSEESFSAPSGGPGYYRVPTLISAWATAPFLHNNALGKFNNDPSVTGRLEAFEDAIQKLLWPEKRLQDSKDPVRSDQLEADGGLIWRTSAECSFHFGGYHVPDLFGGITGWPQFWVQLVPWVPSIGFVLLGTALLLIGPLISLRQKLEAWSPWLRVVLSQVRIWIALIAFASAAAIGYLVWRKLPTLDVLEAITGWFPWLRIQAFLPAVFLFLFGLLFILHKLPVVLRQKWAHAGGAVCLLAALVTALSFGRFLSGHGDDIKFGPFPPGMPVNAIANMNPEAPLKARKAALHSLTDFVRQSQSSESGKMPSRREFEERVAPALMAVSKCPDFVMDRGHDFEFIRRMSDEDKKSLIELIKTF